LAVPRTNADLIAEQLHAAGVRHAFGIPSGQVLAIIEAMRKVGIDFVLVSHEGAAGFMADVTGRLTGVPGVAVATVGPGATNLTTGIGNAWLDRSPALAITGQVPVAQLNRRVQMRIDHQALYRPIVKASHQLTAGSISAAVGEALALAVAEPPGPVHLDLPEDVAVAPCDGEMEPSPQPSPRGRGSSAESSAQLAASRRGSTAGDLEWVMDLLRGARKPVAALGFSLYRSGVLAELRRFLEGNHLPFVTTNMAKGVVPEDHSLWLGVVGRARRKTIEDYLAQADLVIGIGYDPVEISYEEWLPKGVPLVHVDGEAADVDGSVRLEHQAIGDLAASVRWLAEASATAGRTEAGPGAPVARREHSQAAVGSRSTAAIAAPSNEWSDAENATFREHLEASVRVPSEGFQPWQALDVMRELLPADAILACDVGAHTHLVATLWRVTVPETLLVSNGWSSMGYAIPAALAAKLARPERTVCAVIGDGCFLMMAGEMATAARLGLPVVFVVLNDSWLSLIKVKQERRDYAYAGVETGSPEKVAPEYFGVPNLVARTPEEFRQAFQTALQYDGPTVVEAMVRPEIYSTILYG
jgi:acetolactate synthase I/II/III large subunit